MCESFAFDAATAEESNVSSAANERRRRPNDTAAYALRVMKTTQQETQAFS